MSDASCPASPEPAPEPVPVDPASVERASVERASVESRESARSNPSAPELLRVGWVGKAHGLKGEVIVRLTSNRTERVEPGAVLHSDRGPLVITASAAHQGNWRVKFDGVGDRTGAERLRGLELRAEPIEVPGELWVHELVGSEVRDTTGAVLGTVQSVEDNPASDLLVLEGERLVPLTFVVSHEPGLVVVDPPAGLFDL